MRRSVSAPSVRRLLRSISATASASERPCVSNWPASWARSLSVWVVMVWKPAICCSTSVLATPVFCATSFMAATNSETRVTSVLSIVAHVLVRAAQHLLQQDVGLAQPLEQGGRVGAQHAVRLEISETAEDAVCFDCSTAAWVVSCSSRSVRVMVLEALCVATSAVSRSSLIERVIASLEAALADVCIDLQLLERAADVAGRRSRSPR